MKDVVNIIVHFLSKLIEWKEGYIFRQLYLELITSFNIVKVIPFKNKGYKSLIVNLLLANALSYTSRIIVFKVETCKHNYLISKY